MNKSWELLLWNLTCAVKHILGQSFSNFSVLKNHLGLPWSLSGKDDACNAGGIRAMGSICLLGNGPACHAGDVRAMVSVCVSGNGPACNAEDVRDVVSIPGLGRPPGEANGNPL